MLVSPLKLDWDDASGASSYNVFLDRTLVASHLSSSEWIVNVPISSGFHTWRVQAINDCGNTFGPAWQFTVQECSAPGVPAGPNPTNNATLTASPIRLNWADTARATGYDEILDGVVAGAGLEVSEWNSDVALGAGPHFWYVIARNDCGATRGPVWRFTVAGCLAPAIPTGPNPTNNFILPGAPALLNWADAARATSYDVYLNGALVASHLPTSEWQVGTALPTGTNLWYVVARNDCGETRGAP